MKALVVRVSRWATWFGRKSVQWRSFKVEPICKQSTGGHRCTKAARHLIALTVDGDIQLTSLCGEHLTDRRLREAREAAGR